MLTAGKQQPSQSGHHQGLGCFPSTARDCYCKCPGGIKFHDTPHPIGLKANFRLRLPPPPPNSQTENKINLTGSFNSESFQWKKCRQLGSCRKCEQTEVLQSGLVTELAGLRQPYGKGYLKLQNAKVQQLKVATICSVTTFRSDFPRPWKDTGGCPDEMVRPPP